MDRPRRLVALDLDSLDIGWAMSFADSGELPNLKRLFESSVRMRSAWPSAYLAENVNTAYLTGCYPSRTGFWSFYDFNPRTYQNQFRPQFDFQEYPVFYRYLAPGKVTSFDLPQVAPDPRTPGVQVTDWGTHGPRSASSSIPEDLLGKLVERFGPSDLLANDNLNLTDPGAMEACFKRFFKTLPRRAAITRYLLEETEWELFTTTVAETHSALHGFWPSPNLNIPQYRESMLHELYREIDRTVGAILEAVPEDSGLFVFSVEGMGANGSDLPAMVFLPELLYRYSFRGAKGLDFDRADLMKAGEDWKPCRYWKEHLLPILRKPGFVGKHLRRYLSPEQAAEWERRLGCVPAPFPPHKVSTNFKPSMWYSPLWRQMKAFALPSFFSGLVRVNLAGREGHGVVPASDYHRICDELSEMLYGLRNPDGTPAVRNIEKTRPGSPEDRHGLPQADLIVEWNPENGDQLHCPIHGQLGPACPTRSGAHTGNGFAWYSPPGGLKGPPCGRDLNEIVSVVDFAPTILALLGRKTPDKMDGKSFAEKLCAASSEPEVANG